MIRNFLFICIIASSFSADGQTFSDYSKAEVVEDLDFLYDQLQLIHPNAAEMEKQDLGQVISAMAGTQYSESDAFFILNGLLKNLNDGHSNVRFSSERTKEIIEYGEFFPYELEFFDSTAVVIGAIGSLKTDVLRREIFKINNVPIKEILDNLTVVAMMDGELNGSENEWIANDFWFYFSLYNGFRNSYSITYLENGKQQHEIAKAVNRSDFLKSSFLDDFKSEPVELSYVTGIPVLKVSNFNQKSAFWWKSKMKSICKSLEEEESENLVLDLRDNGGGQENLQNVLLKIFGISADQKYEYEAIRSVKFNELEGVCHSRSERIKMYSLEKFSFTKKDGEFFKMRKSNPKKRETQKLYHGNLYVLIDGTTFSCASDAAAILKHQFPNTTLIGTETRGSGKVNYAGYFLHISLPNTGMEIRIPRVKYVINHSSCSKQTGIYPDVRIEMKKTDIQRNIDSQLSYIIDHLKSKDISAE